MAKLEDSRIRLEIEKKRKQMSSIKKKMEIQKKKEDLGESWKYIGNKEIKEEMRKVVGDFDTPTIRDSIDINEYFDPIIFYKKENGEILQEDYKKYLDTEEAYEKAIEDQNNIINDIESDEDNLQNLLKKTDKEDIKKPKEKKLSKGLLEIYKNISMNFNRFIPKYNKYICSCCGKPKDINKFFIQYKEINSAFIDDKGSIHIHICKDCCKKLYEFLYYKNNKDGELAMQYFCCYLNYYYDKNLYITSKQDMEEDGMKKHIIEYYIKNLNSSDKYRVKNFIDSSILNITDKKDDVKNSIENNLELNGWNKEDKKNRDLVLKMVGYDPFDYETDENKRMLYKDLLGMLEQGMEYDQVKLQAAIQIVTSFLRIREMNQLYRKKENEGATVTELKALSDLKKKELEAITSFSRDNGFSERYATAKAKGENTFTGILNKMNEAKFEKAILNKYDIETSETISQAAEASIKAIFTQLSLGEAEVWKLAQEQLGELQKLRRENSSLQEQLRKAKYEVAKMELEEKAKEYNLKEEEY